MRPSEENNESSTEDLEGDGGESDPFESSGIPDRISDNKRPSAAADVVDVGDVAGVLDAESVHRLEVWVEVAVPAVERDPGRHGEKAGSHDCAVV